MYNAICGYLEAAADDMRAPAEPEPSGDTFTSTELDGREEPAEVHQQHRPPANRLGFNNNHL